MLTSYKISEQFHGCIAWFLNTSPKHSNSKVEWQIMTRRPQVRILPSLDSERIMFLRMCRVDAHSRSNKYEKYELKNLKVFIYFKTFCGYSIPGLRVYK